MSVSSGSARSHGLERGTQCDVLVVGGGLGGVAAALAALERGRTVVITEPTRWLGGQLTSQGVPPDEHPWIEQFGCTGRYRALRDAIRWHYRTWYPLTRRARSEPHLNPGEGKVSRLCHEPRVAAAVIENLLMPFEATGQLCVLREHQPVEAECSDDRVLAVRFEARDGAGVEVRAAYVIEATELGELAAIAGIESVTGFESRRQTGEPNAPEVAQPANMQAFSWCFALDHVEGADLTIDRPASYGMWREFRPPEWPGNLLGFSSPHPRTLEPVQRTFRPNAPVMGRVIADQRLDPGDDDLWAFRRILSRRQFVDGTAASDVTLVNWPGIDYLAGPLIGVDDAERDEHLRGARELSLSMLYWLQTEAPRPDGGAGWPGLRLRGDVLGTADGLAMAPYIRESRRMRTEYTVVEQDLSLAVRGAHGAVAYHDTVGIGAYRIDLHPSTGGDNYIDVASSPYQIPLGALLPVQMTNVLAGGKTMGTTHITNGCYRLHPTEWNVGEAAGALAAYCLRHKLRPTQVRANEGHLTDFQADLVGDGFELAWPDVGGY